METTEPQPVGLLEELLVGALLVPLELLVQFLQAVLRAVETLAWSALTSKS